jgi:hypothetical protein
MKRRHVVYLMLFMFAISFNACEMAEQFDEKPVSNFEAFWKLMDENYCFFDYKKVDWNALYFKYRAQVNDSIGQLELFRLLSKMADELQDGHINIISRYSFYSYDGWYTSYPSNFNWDIVQKLLENCESTGYYDEIKYTLIENGEIGYIYYGSFSESILETELNKIFETFLHCKGLIIDVRNNGGGSLTNSDRLASRFTNKRIHCGYMQHKTGKGHNSFSEPYPLYLEASPSNVLWLKPVVLLTNRRSYSAANNFVSKMQILSNVHTLGDTTGGGSGFPFTSELPNGWRVRFSSSPILNVEKQHTEFGINPDIKVALKHTDEEKGIDTLIETAVRILMNEL